MSFSLQGTGMQKQKVKKHLELTGKFGLGKQNEAGKRLIEFFQEKPFNITVIQVYPPTSNAEEAEVEMFYEDLQDLLELTPKKDVLFIIGDWNAKVGSQETPRVTQIWPWNTE